MSDYVMICKDSDECSIFYNINTKGIYTQKGTKQVPGSAYLSGAVGVILYSIIDNSVNIREASGVVIAILSFVMGAISGLCIAKLVINSSESMFVETNREIVTNERLITLYNSGKVFWKQYNKFMITLAIISVSGLVVELIWSMSLLFAISVTVLICACTFMFCVSRPLCRKQFAKQIIERGQLNKANQHKG